MTELRCEYCDTPAHSQSELFACEIKCEREDNMTRRWTKRYDFHRKD